MTLSSARRVSCQPNRAQTPLVMYVFYVYDSGGKVNLRIPDYPPAHSNNIRPPIPDYPPTFDALRLGRLFFYSVFVAFVKGFDFCFPHGLSIEFEAIGVVNDAVEDGVGEGWFTDDFMPDIDGELAGDEG